MSTRNTSTDLTATLARNIRAAREAKGWTQHQLAVALGRGDAMTVSRWERGEHVPSIDNLVVLADVLAVTVAWLHTDHDEAAA